MMQASLFDGLPLRAPPAAEPLSAMPGWVWGNLKPGAYGLILADPPWSFRAYSARGEGKSPQAHYGCMSTADIMALPVSQLATPDCACVMWATAPMLPQAIATMQAWGFAFKSAGAWAKQSSTGQRWAFGTGYCYRSAAEFFLLGTIGKPRQRARNVRNLIVAPVREHSRKPERMRADIETLWPGPYCELFARTTAPGWDCWGNQTDRFSGGEILGGRGDAGR